MLKNFFKVIFRDLLKDKVYTSISILGLSAAAAIAILIISINFSFLTFDRYHEKGDRIYQALLLEDYAEKGESVSSTTPYVLGQAVKDEYPEIADVVTVLLGFPMAFNVNDIKAEQTGIYADASLFNIFSFPVIASASGSRKQIFQDINSIAISRSTAEKYFGSVYNSIGKRILLKSISERRDVYVSSVYEDIPVNTSGPFRSDYVMPLEAALRERTWLKNWPWGNFVGSTYFELKPGVNVNELNKKIKNFIHNKAEFLNCKVKLYKFEDLFMSPPPSWGPGKYYIVGGLFLVAGIILTLAGINFINLAVSRGTKKQKEIGLRKVIGSGRLSLVARFLGETMVLSVFALLFGLITAELLMPMVNNTFNGMIKFSIPYNNFYFTASLPALAVVLGLLSGFYPALYLSSLSPAGIIKGQSILKKGTFLRNGLLVVQFVFSAVYIFLTVLIYRQIMYISNKDFGMNIKNVIGFYTTSELNKHKSAFTSDLKKNPYIMDVTYSSFEPIEIGASTSDPKWAGKPEALNDMFPVLSVEDNFLSTFRIKLVKGRDFIKGDSVDNNNVIINEEMEKIINKSNSSGVIGLGISYWGQSGQIVGVVKNFNINNIAYRIGPVLLRKEQGQNVYGFVRYNPENLGKVLSFMEKTYGTYEKEFPLKYNFMDEKFINKHLEFKFYSRFFPLFSGIAIAISCLGLFGLTAFNIQRKLKEVGIRKVLGASSASISLLLTKSYIKIVAAAALIALPLEYYASDIILRMYVYKVNPGPELYIISFLIVLVISSLTVVFQALKAASANPVNSLKYE